MAELNKTGLVNGIENLLAARNYTLAKKFVEELLELDPSEQLAWDCAVRAYAPLGDIERAHAFGRRLIEKNPGNYRGYELLAYVGLVALRHPPSSAAVLPWNIGPSARLAFVEDMANQSLQLNPNNPWTIGYLARVQLTRGNVPAALETASSGLAQDPRHIPLLLVRAEGLYIQRKFIEAKETLLQAMEISPNNVDVNSLLASVYKELKQPSKAFDHISTAVALAPHRKELQDLYWETSRLQIAPIRWLVRLDNDLKVLRPVAPFFLVLGALCLASGSERIFVGGCFMMLSMFAILIMAPLTGWLVHLLHAAFSRDYRRSSASQPLKWVMLGAVVGLAILIGCFIAEASPKTIFAIETGIILVLIIAICLIPSARDGLAIVLVILLVCYGVSAVYLESGRHNHLEVSAMCLGLAAPIGVSLVDGFRPPRKPGQ